MKEIHDCLFVHCSTPTYMAFTTDDGSTYTGTEAIECVFASVSNWPAGIATTDCHVVTGSAIGTGGTTGAWFDTDPSVDPWSLLPSSGNLDSATGVVPYPSDWWWAGATGPTRGCSRMVGTGSWSLSIGTPVLGESDLPTLVWSPAVAAARLAILGQAGLPALTWAPSVAVGQSAILGAAALPALSWAPLEAGTLFGIVGSADLTGLLWDAPVAGATVGILGSASLPDLQWSPPGAGILQPTLVTMDLPSMIWSTISLEGVVAIRIPPPLMPGAGGRRKQWGAGRVQHQPRRDSREQVRQDRDRPGRIRRR